MNKSNGSMNRLFRVVWNAAAQAWQAVAETARGQGKSKSVKQAGAVLVAALSLAQAAHAAPSANEFPTGGVVTGSATISVNGARMDVQQSAPKVAIDWNTFNIGTAAHVHFEQPAGGAALNRVLDTNASQIYGRLTSTGQVFLVNPNGVFFAPGAQVDVGSLVASTLGISNANFMAGNYTFEGASSSAIINQGNITAASGGTVALIAAKITNDGNLTAQGGNVLLGAGSKVTLDMGGPVKLQIENDALETLVQNGGAIKADGGVVWLTSQAASNLASSVISNTGVIEAQALGTGETGEIILFAHDGHMQVGGSIKAEGGFVETSGRTFAFTEDTQVQASHWLVDPVNITIDAGLATAIEGALGTGDVTITTAGGNTPATTAGESGTDGDITVNSAITWNTAQKLTLFAHRNIFINQSITVENSAGELALHYGQGAVASANAADYSFGVDGLVSLPNGGKFTEKLGSDGAAITSHFGFGAKVVPVLTINNSDSGVKQDGVQGPFLWEIAPAAGNHMFTLDPIGDTNDSNLASTSAAFGMSGDSVTYLNSVFNNGTTNFSYFYQTVSLAAGQTLTRLWNYTSTDYAPFNDGSFLSFVNTTNPSDISAKIYGLANPVFVLGATVSGTGNWSTKSYGSTGWQTVTLQAGQAGDYRIGFGVFNLDDTSLSPVLAVVNSAGTATLNGQIFTPIPVDPNGPLGSSGVVIVTPDSPSLPPTDPLPPVTTDPLPPVTTDPLPPVTTDTVPKNTAVSNAQSSPVEPVTDTGTASAQLLPTSPPPNLVVTDQGSLPVFDVSGGLVFVQVPATPAGGGSSSGSTTSSSAGGTDVPTDQTDRDALGFVRVFVVGDGVNTAGLPEVDTKENQRRNVPQQ